MALKATGKRLLAGEGGSRGIGGGGGAGGTCSAFDAGWSALEYAQGRDRTYASWPGAKMGFE